MRGKWIGLAVLLAGLWNSISAYAGVASSDAAAPASVEVNSTIEWNRTLLTIVRTPGAQPASVHSTRNFAILHVAMFDAVNSIDRTFKPYAVHVAHVSAGASVPAAADQAAHDVLVSLYPDFAAKLDSELEADLAQIPPGKRKADGVRVGEIVAAEILALRSNDGAGLTLPPFVPRNQAGDYQLTPPNLAAADFIQWPRVRPFALKTADQFRPGPPPLLTSDEYTRSFHEVKSLGFIHSATRTADQTEVGRFWNGNIQDFWNEIAQTSALSHNLGPVRTAHLFAALNLSLADTAIAFFDAKYTYDLWRPVTAIRMAEIDGNPQTLPDTGWLPLSTKTAPDPSYPGAHSAISSAAAQVLGLFFGDRASFDVQSESLPGVTRHFTSFSGAAEEAGLSRIYAGQHFRLDHQAGQLLGRRVAEFVLSTTLRFN